MQRLKNLPLSIKLPFAITTLVVAAIALSAVLPRFLGTVLTGGALVAMEIAVLAVVATMVGILIARGITRPLVQIANTLHAIGTRDYAVEVPISNRGDEIGHVVEALVECRNQLVAGEEAINERAHLIEAIGSTQGMIEFDPSGKIVRMNQAFLDVVGYTEAEVMGRHHSMFVPSSFADSSEYRKMWDGLSRGEPLIGTFVREGKGGRTIYLQGAYSPVLDNEGRVVRVVKVASSVTNSETARREVEQKTFAQASLIEAIGSSQGMIEFDVKGTVMRANQAFEQVMGYSESEIVGRPHATFVDSTFSNSIEYRRMWEQLAAGQAIAGVFKRIGKGGRTVYLQGAYSPIRDQDGKVTRVVKVASDITEAETERRALDADTRDQAALIEAISGGLQGMIEFDPKGNILRANGNFLEIVGYSEAEVTGRHHSMFAEESLADTSEYRRMWESLAAGQPMRGTFQRVAKGGRTIYLQASYNPVRDAKGNVVRVVKVASDVTEMETKRLGLEEETFEQSAIIDAISKSQAIIEFDTKGKILKANENFLNLMGYSEQEIVGRPHATFAKGDFAQTKEYRDMWRALADGESTAGTFERVTKSGRTVWLQGSYSAVRDRQGNVKRVVKMAADITAGETERLDGIEQRRAMEADLSQVINSFNDALSNLADGDLSVRIAKAFAEEYEDLRENFNAAIEQLESTISSVVVNAGNIRNELNQVATAADELAQRTENQAAALEETAAALEELTTSVKAAAEAAETASTDVAGTRKAAVDSGRVVKKAVKAMSKIEKSSDQISQIIGVIEDIAFQTNLLALNAGVEAARAGDAGRGFAVVASEVQALATRSSDAAKEIKALISTSSQQVGTGVELVGETGKALATIVESVSAITKLVDGIASSAREQSVGIGEINTAVGQLDQVTQQNAAMVEEANAASHTMRSEAEALSELVGKFQTSGTGTGATSRGPGGAPKNAKTNVTKMSPKAASSGGGRSNGNAALAEEPQELMNDWEEF